MFVYSIYDKVSKSYGMPFFLRDDLSAKRCVLGMLSKDSQLVLYPSSYDLYELGTFDESNGYLETEKNCLYSLCDLIPEGLREFALDGSFKK